MNRQKQQLNASHEFSILDAYDSYEINPHGRNIFARSSFSYMSGFLFWGTGKIHARRKRGVKENQVCFSVRHSHDRERFMNLFFIYGHETAFATWHGHHIQRDRERVPPPRGVNMGLGSIVIQLLPGAEEST
jgi:hypothetical protein